MNHIWIMYTLRELLTIFKLEQNENGLDDSQQRAVDQPLSVWSSRHSRSIRFHTMCVCVCVNNVSGDEAIAFLKHSYLI